MSIDECRSGMGSIGFWGNTPALDLMDVINSCRNSCSANDKEINILLLGQADCRHILKTIANNPPETETQIIIHIVESHPVLYARQLLLLHLALLPRDKIGPHEKITAFMEIFGNTLIRPQTRKIIKSCCETLIRIVTDDHLDEHPMISVDGMKHRERDMIAEILKFWADSSMTATEMQDLWDKRLRHCLTSRYDTRLGAFDWDYQMRILEKCEDTKIINVREYKTWRDTGIAFSEYENDYNQPNITLIAGKNQPYLGDILIGPFIPYGIETKDKSFFEKVNQEFKKKSQDLTFHTLQDIFSKLSSQGSSFRINFLPIDASENLWKKSKYLGKFDFVLASNLISHQIKPELIKLLNNDEGIVVAEKTKYVWYFREMNDKAFESKVLELADAAGLHEDLKDEFKYKSNLLVLVPLKIKVEGNDTQVN